MNTKTPVPAALTDLIEPLVAESGLDIYDLERSGPIIRVIVDLPADRKVPVPAAGAESSGDTPPPGVGIADIAKLTRAISRAIDEHDPIPGQFTLEVTSPGLERNLRTPLHFAGAVGEKVSVKTVHTYEGDRRISGLLVASDDDGITLARGEVDASDPTSGDTQRIDYHDIDKARTLYEWGAKPKPGSNKSTGPSSKKQPTKSSSKKAKAS